MSEFNLSGLHIAKVARHDNKSVMIKMLIVLIADNENVYNFFLIFANLNYRVFISADSNLKQVYTEQTTKQTEVAKNKNKTETL